MPNCIGAVRSSTPIPVRMNAAATALIGRLIGAGDDERNQEAVPDGFLFAARRLYYDTALQIYPAQLWPLKNIVGASQIVFGTDYPFPALLGQPLERLREAGVFSRSDLHAIDRGNAERLFPAFARPA